MLQTLSDLYKRCVIGRPLVALLVVLAITVLAAAGLPNFKLDASSDSLTLEHDADLDYFREINQRYQSGDFLVVTYRPYADLFSDESIEVLQQLKSELSAVPGVSSTLSMLDAPLLYSPKISLTDIGGTPRTLLTPGVDRQAAKQEFLTSPIYRQMLLGPDGRTTAMLLNLEVDEKYIELVRHRDALRLKRDKGELSAAEQVELEAVSKEFLDYRTQAAAESHQRVEQVRSIVDKYRDRAEIFVGGATMVTADMISFIKSDLKNFGVGVLLFMILIMVIIFRQPRYVILPILTCIAAVVIMLGFLSWVDWRLTVISSNFVALLLIISLAITIHLLVRYREFHAADPDAPQSKLVWNTVAFMALPCLYTTLTTMTAFISLVVSDIRPVIDFGWMMTIGLGVALVLSFLVIPAGLMLLPKGKPRDSGDNSHVFTTRFSKFTEHHPTLVLMVSVLLAVLSAVGISRLEVENKFIDYFHKSTEIYQGMLVIDRNLGGTINLEIILDAPNKSSSADESDVAEDSAAGIDDEFSAADSIAEDNAFGGGDPFGAEDPFGSEDPFGGDDPFAPADNGKASSKSGSYWFTVAGLEELEALQKYLESLPEVGKVQSLAIAYEVANDISGGQLNNFELALMQKSLPKEVADVLITPYLSEANDQTRVTMRIIETSPKLSRIELLRKIRHHAIHELGFAPEQVHFSGLLVLYNNMLQSLFTSQIVTLGAVFLGILFMFIVLFRSLLLAVIALIPNLLAAAVVLGGMGIVGVPLDMMTITIAAITVGIGVDFSIHYLYRFRKEFAQCRDYVQAMHASHASIGRAMFYTSVIIILGFSILSLSKFIPTIYFGLLTGVAMLAAILAALTLLPRLVLLIKPLGSPDNGGQP